MANSKLMEAAAEILAGSKKSAGGMPSQRLPGAEAEDLGGPTPENGKPDDDSQKIHAGKGATQMAAPTTKPSAASAKMEEVEGEVIDEMSHDGKAMKMKMKEKMKEDIDALFSDDDTISEEF